MGQWWIWSTSNPVWGAWYVRDNPTLLVEKFLHGLPIYDDDGTRLHKHRVPIGIDKYDWCNVDISDPASNKKWFEPCNRYVVWFVGYKLNTTRLTMLRRLFLQVNRRTQTEMGKYAIRICRCILSKDEYRVQTLNNKELIIIGLSNKNMNPESSVNRLGYTVTITKVHVYERARAK